MSDLVNYDLKPNYVSKEFSDTVSEIIRIVGKTTRTVLRALSLLKLVPKIQEVIIAGAIQGDAHN
jgi:hypothetical protein